MTEKPAPERVSILGPQDGVVRVPKAKQREAMDAPEPGFYRDPFDGKIYRTRRRSSWWTGYLERHRDG